MGFAIAEAAQRRGHDVTLIAGPVHLATPVGVERIDVVTARDMQAALDERITQHDALIMCAAVCDYRPREYSEHKVKKSGDAWSLELVQNPDIVASLADRKESRIFIGFALESQNGEANAKEKMQRKGLDAIALNSPENIGGESGKLTVLFRDGHRQDLGPAPKRELAEKLIEITEQLR